MKTARELAEELCSVRLNIIRREGDADAIRRDCEGPGLCKADRMDMIDTEDRLRRSAEAMREDEAAILAELDTLDRTSRGER